jgi:hypothetical protein
VHTQCTAAGLSVAVAAPPRSTVKRAGMPDLSTLRGNREGGAKAAAK